MRRVDAMNYETNRRRNDYKRCRPDSIKNALLNSVLTQFDVDELLMRKTMVAARCAMRGN